MKKTELSKQHQGYIKQMYLQESNETISEKINVKVQDIEKFLKSENLVRNEYTKNKLQKDMAPLEVIATEVKTKHKKTSN